MIELRSYQSAMIDGAREHFRAGTRRVLMVAPTGAGKRLMAVHMIGRSIERGRRCWFLVHRQELLDQAAETLRDAGLSFGVIKAGHRPDYRCPLQLASIQSLGRRLSFLPAPDFIFADEAHHARAATWDAILAAYSEAFILGFTATPQRLDGKSLGKQFNRLVIGPAMSRLIADGWLAGYRLFAPPAPDTSSVRITMGDFNRGQLAEAVDKPKIVGDVVAHYRRYASGTQAIGFAVNILHSEHLAAAFNNAGISARHVDGDTPAPIRAQLLTDFSAGRFRVLCNVDILGEGLDVAGIETVICARPTQSLSVYLQQVGRGLRVKSDGRDAIILDHAGNSLRHGLPDEDRQWALEDETVKRKRPSGQGIKICEACFAAITPQHRICPVCGHVFVIDTAIPEHADGELQAVNASVIQFQRRQEQGMARDLADLVRIGESRGYRHPRLWAGRVLLARERAKRRSA